ncbi:hypothetical protein BVX93_00100 [bacterium B13(2017)]|nr:hypothetical protein BVX93_00100 [bacterium B13(2017)]
MARISRIVIPKIPHHVTQRGVRSINIFNNDKDRGEYLSLIKMMGERYGLTFLGYCLMNNHVHFIVIPKDKDSLALGIGEAHRRYTRMKNLDENVRGHLFQERFYSCPLDSKHTISAMRYVERNPVRANIVKQAWHYNWSSAKMHVGMTSKDKLVTYNSLDYTAEEWHSMLKNEPHEIKYIRKCYKTGKPCGEMKFFIKIKKITGKDFTPKKTGPKPKYLNT